MSAIDGFVIEPKPVAHFSVGAIDQLPGMIRATGAGQVVAVTDDALAGGWPTSPARSRSSRSPR